MRLIMWRGDHIIDDRRELRLEIDSLWDAVEASECRYGATPQIAAELAEIRRRLHALAQERPAVARDA